MVAHTDAPVASSGPAVFPALFSKIARMRSAAEAALAAVISTISAMLAARTVAPPRSIRTGLTMLRPISSAPSRAGSSAGGNGLVKSGGSRTCKTMATTTLSVTGHRRSPGVLRIQAGTKAVPGLARCELFGPAEPLLPRIGGAARPRPGPAQRTRLPGQVLLPTRVRQPRVCHLSDLVAARSTPTR